MDLYFFAEHDDLEDEIETIQATLKKWSEEHDFVEFVWRHLEAVDKPKTKRTVEIGVEASLSLRNTKRLNTLLNGLQSQAMSLACDFVLGKKEEDGSYSDVCYFGKHEGRPDSFEIVNYLSY